MYGLQEQSTTLFESAVPTHHEKSSLDQLRTTWYNRDKGYEPVDQQQKSRRLSAVKAADVINVIEGILCVRLCLRSFRLLHRR